MNTPAYMKGFLDGYERGVESNPYESTDPRVVEYHRGYIDGIAYYCNETLPEEQEVQP